MEQPAEKDPDVDRKLKLRFPSIAARIKNRKAFNEERKRQRRSDAKTGNFTPRAQNLRAWVRRRPDVPEDVLQRAIESDKEAVALKKTLAVPYKQRCRRAAELILESKMPALESRLAILEKEVAPYLDKVMEYDTKIRQVTQEMEYLQWLSKRVKAPTDKQLQMKLEARLKRIKQAQGNMILARQQLELRKIRGAWGKYGKKRPTTINA